MLMDGGFKSGSGIIVRYSMALAKLLGKEAKTENIRQQRDKPAST
jgi:RNA 3'-terminal phosphate cyclase